MVRWISQTTGNFHYIPENEIEKTITRDIYNTLVPIKKPLKDITIVDYFPEEIIKNFDFAYVTKANIGTISTQINRTNQAITWTIPELANGQTATVQYKLKLKENFDSSLINKVFNTNQKVDITYTNSNEEKKNQTSNISPKLKLTEPVPTTAPVQLPKAGSFTLIGFSIIAIGLLGCSILKLTIFHKQTK